MFEAVRDTFWELLNMRDPNAHHNPYRVGRPKVQAAIKTYLGVAPKKTEVEIQKLSRDAPKPPITAPAPRPAPEPRPAPAPKPVPKQVKVEAKQEARRLAQNAKLPNPGNEPNEGTWNEVLPKEPEPLAKVRLENRLKKNLRGRPPTWSWTRSTGSFSS